MADAFEQEITTLYEAREQKREARRLESSLSPRRGPRFSNLSFQRFRSSTRYRDRPAAALENEYLSRDPGTSRRAAYIRRTMAKARRWAKR
jgi:hypothetical protein